MVVRLARRAAPMDAAFPGIGDLRSLVLVRDMDLGLITSSGKGGWTAVPARCDAAFGESTMFNTFLFLNCGHCVQTGKEHRLPAVARIRMR